MDSGMDNTSGAGWVVRTQAERGAFYQSFTLALLKSKLNTRPTHRCWMR